MATFFVCGVQHVFVVIFATLLLCEATPTVKLTDLLRTRRQNVGTCMSAVRSDAHREISTLASVASCPFKVCDEKEIVTVEGKVKVPVIVCKKEMDNCYQVYKKYDVIIPGSPIKDKVKIPVGCVYSTVLPPNESNTVLGDSDKMSS